jgi:hypothetical protein
MIIIFVVFMTMGTPVVIARLSLGEPTRNGQLLPTIKHSKYYSGWPRGEERQLREDSSSNLAQTFCSKPLT